MVASMQAACSVLCPGKVSVLQHVGCLTIHNRYLVGTHRPLVKNLTISRWPLKQDRMNELHFIHKFNRKLNNFYSKETHINYQLIIIFTLNSLLCVLIPAPNSRRIITVQWPALVASISGVWPFSLWSLNMGSGSPEYTMRRVVVVGESMFIQTTQIQDYSTDLNMGSGLEEDSDHILMTRIIGWLITDPNFYNSLNLWKKSINLIHFFTIPV